MENDMHIHSIENHESQVRTYCRDFPALFDIAKGSFVEDTEGNRYLDFLAGAGSLNYGHNDPKIAAKLIEHLTAGRICQSLDLYTVPKAEFIATFVKHIMRPRGLGEHKIQFVGPTGTNAVEAALKLARKVTRRSDVVAFTDAFHGVSLGSLAACGERGKRAAAGVHLHDVVRGAFENFHGPAVDTIALLETYFSDPNSGVEAPAAFIVEPVQGEGGLNTASPQWMRRLADLAARLGSLLIVDEVQTGCGRTGHFFAFEESGIIPDIVCVSKSIGGFGLPMALLLVKPHHDVWAPGEHNGTFRGSNLSFVAATAAIDHYWRDECFITDVRHKAQMVRARLNDIAGRYRRVHVVGRGLMIGLRFKDPKIARAVCAGAFTKRLIVETCGPDGNTIKLLPPLTTSLADLEAGLEIIAGTIEDVAASEHFLAGAA